MNPLIKLEDVIDQLHIELKPKAVASGVREKSDAVLLGR